MTKPKLLHISLGTHNQEIWRSFDRNFETRHYDWTPNQHNPLVINQEVRRQFDFIKPDIVFAQLQKGGIISIPTMQYMSDSSVTVLWGGDVRLPIPEWEFQLGRHADISLHVNTHYIDELSKKCVNSDFLNVGFDENIFTPHGATGNYPEIVFLGSNYMGSSNFPLSQLREQMVQQLKFNYKHRFDAYGHNWQSVIGSERFLNQNEEAQAYRSCKIAINLSHFNYGRYSSDRMMRIMGSGAFCLSHNYKDIDKDFKVGEHLDVWNSLEELYGKINYYLANEDEREKIRNTGCEYVRNNHTWNDFAIRLKKMCGY